MLARALALPHMKQRVLNNKLPRELRATIISVLEPDAPEEQAPDPEEGGKKRRTCYICPSKL